MPRSKHAPRPRWPSLRRALGIPRHRTPRNDRLTQSINSITSLDKLVFFPQTYNQHHGIPMSYFIYIISSQRGVLYTGVTNDLLRRIYIHKHGAVPGFSKRYRISRLVYFEKTSSIRSAIEREKQIKGFRRSKKLKIIRSLNPEFKDLSEDWFE